MDKYKRVIKKSLDQPSYKYDCINGEPHPLGIEEDLYVLTQLHTFKITDEVMEDRHQSMYRFENDTPLTPFEQSCIQKIAAEPKIDWAIHNSFDGLYISRQHDNLIGHTNFIISVYMKEVHVTYWNLKFGGL